MRKVVFLDWENGSFLIGQKNLFNNIKMNTVKVRFLLMLLLLMGVWHTSFAQEEMKISGLVKDSHSKPLAGVQVSVKDTSRSTYTDFDGKYVLEITKGAVLRFSKEGMQPQELTPTTSVLDITLLKEGEEAVAEKSGPKGPMNTNSRGQTSIAQTVKPLWVLNGVILPYDVDLKPEDLVSEDAKLLIASAIPGLTAESIESYRVINDASATASYGPRAIAGVVEVVTKKGTAGSSSFTYSNESTYRLKPSYRQYNIMNSQDQMSFVQEMMRKGMMPAEYYKIYTSKGAVGRMYELYNILDANGNPRVSNTEEGRMAYLQAAERRNTNWFNELFQTSVMQNHTISFSSGGEKSTYYTSLSALSDPGWQKGEEFTQYAGNLNATYNFSSKLSLNVITDISYQERRSNGKNMYEYALSTPRTMDPKDDYSNYYAPFNIHRERENNFMTTDLANLRLQAQLNYKFSPKLEATLMGAINYQSGVYNTDATENSNLAQSYRAINESIRDYNDYLYKDPNNPFAVPEIIMPHGGMRTKQVTTFNGNNFRATLNYSDSFSDGLHLLSANAGFDMDNAKNTNDTNYNYGVLFNSGQLGAYSHMFLKYLQERSEGYYNINNTTNNNQAIIGNASYTYNNRYTINGTLRYDASNQFAPSRLIRWMPTWNVGLTWDLSQEKFFSYLTPVLSYWNLYGSVGLTAVSPYASNSYTQLYYDLPWRNSATREIGIYRSNLANHDLTYEKTQEINIGTQIGFWDYRLNMSLEGFKRRSYDLIGTVTTQGVGGQISKYGNIAEMETYGLELGLETTNIRTEDFTWKTSLVYSHATNEITKLNTTPTVGDMVGYSGSGGFARAGYPQGSLFSVPFNGLDGEGLPTFIGPDGTPTRFGVDMKERNVDFLKYSGTLIPTDKGSFSNTLNYKGVSFGLVFTYSWGNVVRLRGVSDIYSGINSDATTLPYELNNRWQFAGDEKKTNIPAIYTSAQEYKYSSKNLYERAYRAYDYSDVRIAKGDNIRLKEISVGYTFDKDFLKASRIRQLSLKLQATNVALLYADKRLNGDDPDYRANGTYVSPKRIIFTLRLGL